MAGPTAVSSLVAGLDGLTGVREKLVHLAAHLALGNNDARALEVAKHLAQHILITRLFEVRLHNGAGVFLNGFQAHEPGGPFAQQAVAARRRRWW